MFFLQESINLQNGHLSPIACHTYLESYNTQLSFGLSGNHFSASYEASGFWWQIALNFLQHLRPCHILALITKTHLPVVDNFYQLEELLPTLSDIKSCQILQLLPDITVLTFLPTVDDFFRIWISLPNYDWANISA